MLCMWLYSNCLLVNCLLTVLAQWPAHDVQRLHVTVTSHRLELSCHPGVAQKAKRKLTVVPTLSHAGSYGMYLASQDGQVSSASTTAAVTQYDNSELQTTASPSAASQSSPLLSRSSPAMSPEPGISLALPLTWGRCCCVYPHDVKFACTSLVSLASPPCLHLSL